MPNPAMIGQQHVELKRSTILDDSSKTNKFDLPGLLLGTTDAGATRIGDIEAASSTSFASSTITAGAGRMSKSKGVATNADVQKVSKQDAR